MKHIKSALILLPNQLFPAEYLPEVDLVLMVEEPLFYGADKQYPLEIHKQKLVLHRASMRWYIEQVLWPKNFNVEYIELGDMEYSAQSLLKAQSMGAELVFMFDPTDHALDARYKKALENDVTTPFELRVLPNPSFMLRRGEVQEFFDGKTKHNFTDFYQYQRERFNILIDEKYKPAGGKWSYEVAKQTSLPAGHSAPGFSAFGDTDYVNDAKKWVEKNFVGNPGSLDNFFWPTTQDEAISWLGDFITQRLENFGMYQEAIDGQAVMQYHSGISAVLNIGLITPQEVVDAVLAAHAKKPLPLASVEGFIRQIIGWREYVRALYITQHTAMRSAELNQSRLLSSAWFTGDTGIPPLDDVIKKVDAHAYAHHIERSMIVGNLMLLCEVSQDEIYKWYASLFIDAYDWCVVPNIYSISRLSDLGGMITKAHISDSTYILEKSHYTKDIWCDIWDGLFWEFVDKHQKLLSADPRTKSFVKQLGKIDADRRRIIAYRAQDFLASITPQ